MSIGSTIKKLRRERDITQEQLADYLGITSRAVSQWECDRTAPDISQLPLLAHIFDTTTDTILGVDLQKNEEKIAEIIENAKAFSDKGEYVKSSEILKNGSKQFPKSYRIMSELAVTLSCVDLNSYAHVTGEKSNIEAISEEVFALCEKVIGECTDNNIRDKAFQTIIYRYKNIGQKSKAAEYANMMSHMWVSREEMLIGVYGNDSDIKLLHDYVAFCADRLFKCLEILAVKSDFLHEDKIKLLQQIIDIINTLYCDGDSNYYAHHLSAAYQTLAEDYALVNDAKNTLTALEGMCKASILFDTYSDNAITTSPAVRGECHGRPVPCDNNCCAIQLRCLQDERWYDFIRDNPRFKVVIDELKKYSDK